MKQLGILCAGLLLAVILCYFLVGRRYPGAAASSKPPRDAGPQAAQTVPPLQKTSLSKDRLPLLSAKRAGSPELFRERYSLVLRQYRDAGNKGGGGFMGKFAYEQRFCIRETRLLALSFPDQVERECAGIARDPQADPLDVTFAMWALRFLALKGRKAAEAVLFEVATAMKNPILADDAIYHLSACDEGAAYRTTYWEGCRAGTSAAFDAVGYRADGATMQFAEELLKSTGEARGDLYRRKLLATTLLERQRLLTSGEWQKKVTDILEQDQGSLEVTWALRCGRANELPGMIDVLRLRLDRAEQEASLTFSSYSQNVQKDIPSSETQFINHPNPIGLRDKAYDEVLVGYVEMGGTVNDLERRRLHTFGYAGDPGERLEAILKLGK